MITEGFVANGAKVYICSRKKETIQKTADALTKRGTLPAPRKRIESRTGEVYCFFSGSEYV
jgi:hypothetical protein